MLLCGVTVNLFKWPFKSSILCNCDRLRNFIEMSTIKILAKQIEHYFKDKGFHDPLYRTGKCSQQNRDCVPLVC